MPAHSRLSIIVFSGDYDRVHYALAMASAAAAVNRPATLFFTMGALKALRRGAAGLAARDAHYAAVGIATLNELIEACAELGVTFMACEMGLKAEGMSQSELRDDVKLQPGGLVTFLADAGEDGRIVFV